MIKWKIRCWIIHDKMPSQVMHDVTHRDGVIGSFVLPQETNFRDANSCNKTLQNILRQEKGIYPDNGAYPPGI